jgi:hypothetical protein
VHGVSTHHHNTDEPNRQWQRPYCVNTMQSCVPFVRKLRWLREFYLRTRSADPPLVLAS